MTNFAVNTGRIGDERYLLGPRDGRSLGTILSASRVWPSRRRPAERSTRSAPTRPDSGLLAGAANPFVGVPDPSYSGWYVEGTWFFGGHRT